jgi:hypothetical protein
VKLTAAQARALKTLGTVRKARVSNQTRYNAHYRHYARVHVAAARSLISAGLARYEKTFFSPFVCITDKGRMVLHNLPRA